MKPTVQEIIMQTLDSNAFTAGSQEGIDVNPQIWDRQLQDAVKANLVVTPYARTYDFTAPGSIYRVTIRDAPTVAAAVAETANVTVQAFTSRYVDFTPSEYGTAFELPRKEMVRAFFDVMGQMTSDLGYAMAWQLDKLVVTTAAASAGTTLFTGGKTAATAVNSTDTLTLSDVNNAAMFLRANYFTPKVLFVNASQYKQLCDITQLQKFNEGSPAGNVIGNGVVNTLFGMQVVITDSIVTASNRATAQAWGIPRSGGNAVGVAMKMAPTIDTQYFAKDRRWDIVGVQDLDVKVLYSNAIAAITSGATI